jgi:hypothetical protein
VAATHPVRAGLRAPVRWGLAIGVAQAATPLAFWWLDTATVYALGLAVVASVYIGFAVADGRRTVLVVESGVASMFLIIAADGLKDFWQHRRQFVANTRWWPPFCLVVDWAVAAIIAIDRRRGSLSQLESLSGVPAQPPGGLGPGVKTSRRL